MPNNILENILSKVRNVADAGVTGGIQRIKFVSSLNQFFKAGYIIGEIPRLLVVKIVPGERAFKHSQSTNILMSGFKIVVQNEESLTKEEMIDLGISILTNTSFVRLLTTMGFDTLKLSSPTKFTGIGSFALNDYINGRKLLK